MRFTRKDVATAEAEASEPGSRLRSELNRVELTGIGLAIVVGAGIFAATPQVFTGYAGPAVITSFVVAAVLCLPVALCYAECASLVRVAGSAYTYAYVAFGRPVAWLLGWLLIMEYTVGAAVVAGDWSHYLSDTLRGTSSANPVPDWGAVGIVAALAVVLLTGIRSASRITLVATAAKVTALLLLILAVGAPLFDLDNLTLHTEDVGTGAAPTLGAYTSATIAGTGVLFYAFIGFDSVSTMAEESRFPRRDVPHGILATLGIATVLYLGVAVVMAGATPQAVETDTGVDRAVTLASIFGPGGGTFAVVLITVGALTGLTTGILALMLGQSRVAFAMTRDGMLPTGLARMRWQRNPRRIILATGVISAAIAAFGSPDAIRPIVNLGTLVVFAVVCASTLVLRYRVKPEHRTGFRIPGGGVVAVFGTAASIVLAVFVVLNVAKDPAGWVDFLWLGASGVLYAAVTLSADARRRRSVWRTVGAPTTSLAVLVAENRILPTHRLSTVLPYRASRRLYRRLVPVPETVRADPDGPTIGIAILDSALLFHGLDDGAIPSWVEERTAGTILAIPSATEEALRNWAAQETCTPIQQAARREQVDRVLRHFLVLPRTTVVMGRWHLIRLWIRSNGGAAGRGLSDDDIWAAASGLAHGQPLVSLEPGRFLSLRPLGLRIEQEDGR